MVSMFRLFLLLVITLIGANSIKINSTKAIAATYEKYFPDENVNVRQFNDAAKSTLNCTISEIPSSIDKKSISIEWKRENKILQNTNTKYEITTINENDFITSQLVISSVQKSDLGSYQCSYKDLIMNTTLDSPPVISFGHKNSRSGMEGDSFNQPCDIAAHPMPQNVTWLKENYTIIYDARIKIEGFKLMFTSLEKSDKGLYICYAENEHGNGKAFIKINVKDKFAALWPFIGIVIEVSILVIIILLYEKKRASKKANPTEEEDGLNVKKVPDSTQDETDVRQRPVKA